MRDLERGGIVPVSDRRHPASGDGGVLGEHLEDDTRGARSIRLGQREKKQKGGPGRGPVVGFRHRTPPPFAPFSPFLTMTSTYLTYFWSIFFFCGSICVLSSSRCQCALLDLGLPSLGVLGSLCHLSTR